jgi:hypothetical protein
MDDPEGNRQPHDLAAEQARQKIAKLVETYLDQRESSKK